MARKKSQPHVEAPRPQANAGRGPFVRFALLFAGLMALFYLFTLTAVFNDSLFPAYRSLNAQMAALLLKPFYAVQVAGDMINSARFSVDVARGCDATGPIALFLSAVLAFDAGWRPKLIGVIVGSLVLFGLNILRIVSLFMVGVHFPSLFHFMHVDFWQALFILLALVFWIIWGQWSSRPTPVLQTVETHV